jgi:hypothetical protein
VLQLAFPSEGRREGREGREGGREGRREGGKGKKKGERGVWRKTEQRLQLAAPVSNESQLNIHRTQFRC